MSNENRTRVVLIACGSFNPITNQHLRNFELARDYLHRIGDCHVIGGLISPVNDGYGKSDLLPAKHRCSMVQNSLNNSEWLKLDTWESEQEEWQETVMVLRHHLARLNSNVLNAPQNKKQKLDLENLNVSNNLTNSVSTWDLSLPVNLKFLCGADLLESFAVPNLWKAEHIMEIVTKFGLVIVTREDSNPLRFIYESDILTKYQKNICIVTEWIRNDVSSTLIRRALRRGESVKYLIPDQAIQYIKEHRLYQRQEKF